mgnify:CR=1 FL=1
MPEDLCLAGYDGIEIMQKSHPRLTTVDQNAALIGRTAAELLVGCGVYGIALLLLRCRELGELLELGLKKLRKSKTP